MMVFAVLAWISLGLLFWVYLGYPIALWILAHFLPKHSSKKAPDELPHVSLIVPTFNEALVIEKKIENIRELDYPKDRLEIFVVDSGSTDGTTSIIAQHAPDITIVPSAFRGGKALAINDTLPKTTGEIVVITDANAFMKPDVIKKVTEHFRDPSVGAVTGAMRQVDRSENAVSQGGGLYWKAETFMRTQEAKLHSVVAMSGEISVFRREMFVNEANDVAQWHQRGGTDDFEMTLWVILQGKRVAYASDAFVWEYAPDTIKDLFKQKVRIIVQTILSVKRFFPVLWKTGWYGVLTFPSRKILPLFSPWALIVLFVSSLFLAVNSITWKAVLFVQIIAYLLAVLGSGLLKNFFLAKFSLFFCLLNGTVLFAWIHYWQGKDYTHWEHIASSRRL